MYPERRGGSPPDSSDGVDFRAVLYGNPRGASSVARGPSPSLGPPSGREFPSAGDSRTSTWGREPPEVMWGNTHYGDWLNATSPSSRRSFLPAGVQRIGEAQRVRGTASYRGPSGISQAYKPIGRPSDTPFAYETGEEYLGAVAREPYIAIPPTSSPPDMYGRPGDQHSGGAGFAFDAPDDVDAAVGDVYVLAPDADPCGIDGQSKLHGGASEWAANKCPSFSSLTLLEYSHCP